MITSTTSALTAYQNQLSLMQEASDSSSGSAATGGTGSSSFASMVEGALKDASSTMHNSENLQMRDATGGKVDLTDLVTAVSNAELTLNTVVAVRDRVISAYQSIIGMSI